MAVNKTTFRRLYDGGLDDREVADALDITVDYARWLRYSFFRLPPNRNQRRAWTPEGDKRILELRAQGHTLAWIGQQVGRTYSAVRDRLRQLRR